MNRHQLESIYNALQMHLIYTSIKNYLGWWLTSPNNYFQIFFFFEPTAGGGSPSGKIIWMLFIILGVVDPLRFFMIEIISKGVEKIKIIWENYLRWWLTTYDCWLSYFILRGCEMMVISSTSLHFFQPRIPWNFFEGWCSSLAPVK